MNADSKISIAPMMEWTDRHYRWLMRQITKKTLLYTEMVTAAAIVHNLENISKIEYLLGHSKEENPLILQLGGDNPMELSKAIEVAENYQYDGFNLNVGCPSNRVQSGSFGACLMQDPAKTARLYLAMAQATDLRVGIKCRIGTDKSPEYEDLVRFVDQLANAGCTWFIVHARIAVLNGLSPKDNRRVPPLRYEDVYKLKKKFPELRIEINGGITDWEQAHFHLQKTDGVMIGRAAYENPLLFMEADKVISDKELKKLENEEIFQFRNKILSKLFYYCQSWEEQGGRAKHVLRHAMGLCHAFPGSKKYRQTISEIMIANLSTREAFDRLNEVDFMN